MAPKRRGSCRDEFASAYADNQREGVGRAKLMFYFYPDDVVALHSTLKANGFAVSDLQVTIYQVNELGRPGRLRFGQETSEPPDGVR